MFNTKGKDMKFEVINIEKSDVNGCFDLTIRNNETGEEVIADMCRIWDNDETALEDMFENVKAGEY
jgi:hypothetical protein